MFVFDSMHIFKFYVQFQTNLRQLTVNLWLHTVVIQAGGAEAEQEDEQSKTKAARVP